MGVILNCNWRFWNSATNSDQVGWPRSEPGQPLWAYQRIAAGCREFREAGFSVIGLPPSTKGAAGVFSDGYDKYDDYSLDGTAFGSAEMLRQCIAVAHACGMQAYGDLVLHQYDGGKAGAYPTRRFPKTPSCFSGIPGGVVPDAVPDESGNFAFGDLAAYVAAEPPGYMHDGAIAATQWLARTTGFDGFRIDDAKGTNAAVIYDILHADYVRDLFAFFEYFDGNPAAISNYVNGYEKRRGSVLDFATKFNIGGICNNTGRAWMGQLADIGWCTKDAATAITFAESADTDNSPGEQIIWNKMLAYAIVLTFPGYPMVYYRDWSTDPGCYGLKRPINNLIWIHEHLAQGDFVVRLDTDPQVFVMERMGYGAVPGCVCFFNNDQWSTYTRTVQTHFGAFAQLHEYTGNGSVNDVWTDEHGRITVTVPRNDNGYGYLVYAPAGITSDFPIVPIETEQVFFGAADLKPSGPLVNGTVRVGRVWCASETYLSATLTRDTEAGWSNSVEIEVALYDREGNELAHYDYDDQGAPSQGFTAVTRAAGWHTVTATSTGLPAEGSPFELRVNYTAPETA